MWNSQQDDKIIKLNEKMKEKGPESQFYWNGKFKRAVEWKEQVRKENLSILRIGKKEKMNNIYQQTVC